MNALRANHASLMRTIEEKQVRRACDRRGDEQDTTKPVLLPTRDELRAKRSSIPSMPVVSSRPFTPRYGK